MFDMEPVLGPRDYHMVAVEPIIGNAEVLHHMVLFGCVDDQEMIDAPFECGMVASSKCQTFLNVWTVGIAGDCSHPMAGVRLGKTGFKRIVIQYHWNNPNHRTDWTDTSGMTIYYTPNLRTYDAGIFLSGSQTFVLPPKRQSVTVSSTCTRGCTRNLLKGPLNITMAWNHMHYAGIQMSIEIKRNNTHYMYLTNDPMYSYDSPQLYTYTDNPVALLAGDEIITRCTYTTANRNHSTFSGEGTYDEMCFGFITYFPKRNMASDFCLSAGPDLSYCDQQSYIDQGCPEYWGFSDQQTVNSSSQYKQLVENCQPFSPCLEECVQYLATLKKSSRCYQGELFELIKSELLMRHEVGRDMMARLASCDTQVYGLLNPAPTTVVDYEDRGHFSKASLTSVTTVVILLTSLLSLSIR
ncbi:hypothetical protein Btru_069948 [Bulinus truncatus]|nr:hypothetical protein Btru_069948 [Bulinus truncatus]